MRTDDLIQALVADGGGPRPSIERRLAAALAAAFVVSAILFAVVLGPRPDVATAATTIRFVLKIVEALVLAATAAVLVLQLVRPGADRRHAAMAVIAAPLLLAIAVAVEMTLTDSSQWAAKLVGSNSRICLTAIPLLSLPILAAALFVLRLGAPTRPGIAGAVAGLVAGGLAAALYAIHCTDDSPLFVATWYSIAIAMVSLVGGIAAHRLLRW
jgi:hypothetical protein